MKGRLFPNYLIFYVMNWYSGLYFWANLYVGSAKTSTSQYILATDVLFSLENKFKSQALVQIIPHVLLLKGNRWPKIKLFYDCSIFYFGESFLSLQNESKYMPQVWNSIIDKGYILDTTFLDIRWYAQIRIRFSDALSWILNH